jgi:endonuclease YncB( thermonuclease family)
VLHFQITKGRVEKVIDGDTLRIRHYPNYPYQKQNEYNGKLYEHTITIRLYGIDAPEIAKNGNPGMAYANESKDYTMSKVNGKIVNVKVFKKDQYSRVLGKVMTDECYPIDSFSTMKVSTTSPSAVCKPNYDYLDVSQGLAHNGLSTLYRGGGAEYDGNKNGLEKEIQFAQINKKGIWTNGVENAQSPAEYKRAMREANAK